MKEFLSQTLEEYFSSISKCEIIDGNTMTRFTVFIDLYTGLLAYQYTYLNGSSEQLEMEGEPAHKPFLCFYTAYEEVKNVRSEKRQDASYYEIIPEMESLFIEYATSKGYREGIEFTIMQVPLDLEEAHPLFKEANPLVVPLELLLQAREKILKN